MRRPPPRALLFLAMLAGCSLRLSGPEPGRGAPAGPGAPCATAADCPTPKEPCLLAACPAGACTVEVAPARAVPAEQPAGDCKQLVCDGRGQPIVRDDPSDLPADDSNDCTEERCVGAEPEHAPLAAGLTCGQGGVCNGAGLCGVCIPARGRCTGGAPEVCDPSGQWAKSAACAGASPVCSRGACTSVVELALGEAETCARLSDGSARCWGADRDGLLSSAGAGRARVGVSGAVELGLGHGHACARLGDGTVSCWGSNASGELGDGTREGHGAPTSVVGLKGAVQLAAGDHHACARLGDGTVACWGRNHRGQLGDGGSGAAPRVIAAAPGADRAATTELLGPFAQLALGGDRACVRLGDGGVECWGHTDAEGAAPAPRPAPHLAPHPAPPRAPPPVKGGKPAPAAPPHVASPPHVAAPAPAARVVRGLKAVVEIALGADHGCARLGDGAVSCWGANGAGQLGDGGATDRHAPAPVGAIKHATALALGRAHTCALLAGGTVSCWGDNAGGQLGDGSTTPRRTPTAVAGLQGVTAIAARGDHTCARLADGGVRCWGDNLGGDLGDGGASARPAPVEVRW